MGFDKIAKVTTLSSRAFNQDTGGAKKAAKNGPVVITNRGKPRYVLINYAEYERLAGKRGNIIDLLAMPDGDKIDFEIPELDWTTFKEIDLS